MGKLFHGPLGRVKGSIGNTTYRRIYGESNASAAYDKVLEVANPRTGNQIYQRMKLAPAQRFYESFKSVLDHSRQGIQAGEKTRRAFMSEVMKDGFKRHPYVTKGFDGLVAGGYPVSKGILQEVGVIDVPGTPNSSPTFDIKVTETGWSSIGDLAADIIDSNPGRFVAGDELTFLIVGTDDFTGTGAVAYVVWFVLDSSNQNPLSFVAANNEDDQLLIAPIVSDVEAIGFVAAAAIHSRKVGTSWQYSTANMVLAGDYDMTWTSSNQYEAMMQSYGAAGYNKVNSNRILKQATNQPANGKISIVTGLYQPEVGNPIQIAYLAFTRSIVSGGNEATTVNTVFVKGGEVIGINGVEIANVTPESVGWNGGTTPWKDEYKSQIP